MNNDATGSDGAPGSHDAPDTMQPEGVTTHPPIATTTSINTTAGAGGVVCTIGLDSFRITNTRSRHEDTDFVALSVAVGSHPPITMKRALGDKNNGTFALNMHIPNIHVAPHEHVVLSYSIVNSGHQDPDAVEKALEKGVSTIAQKGAQIAATAVGGAIGAELGASIGTAVVPILGSALGALAGYLVGGGFGLLFANCDGPVAVAVHVLTAEQIKAAQSGSHHGIVTTDEHPGVDSATGCGSNSHYYVTWSVH